MRLPSPLQCSALHITALASIFSISFYPYLYSHKESQRHTDLEHSKERSRLTYSYYKLDKEFISCRPHVQDIRLGPHFSLKSSFFSFILSTPHAWIRLFFILLFSFSFSFASMDLLKVWLGFGPILYI